VSIINQAGKTRMAFRKPDFSRPGLRDRHAGKVTVDEKGACSCSAARKATASPLGMARGHGDCASPQHFPQSGRTNPA
jgi:hypothetical protein